MPTNPYQVTDLPDEYPAVPVSQQPDSDIQVQYNIVVQFLKELIAMINGGSAGTGMDGTVLKNYTGTGIVDRLEDIETSGKVKNSTIVQVGSSIVAAGDRAIRFILGGVSVYRQLLWDHAAGCFKFNDNAGNLLRAQVATPTLSNDVANKSYVDATFAGSTVLTRYFNSGVPTKMSNTQFAISFVNCRDHLNTFNIVKNSQLIFDRSVVGVSGTTGGILSSPNATTMPGTISVSSGGNTVTGSSTTFLTTFVKGDVFVTAGGQPRMVLNVASDTSMTVVSTFGATETTVAYSRNNSVTIVSSTLKAYVMSNGLDAILCGSYRSVVTGQTLVDLPRVAKTGTVAITNGSKQVVGTGTSFLTSFSPGHVIQVSGQDRIVESVTNDLLLTVIDAFTQTLSGQTAYLYYKYYRQLPFNYPVDASANFIDVSVSGWPSEPFVTFPAYDSGSNFAVFSAQNNTSASSKGLWSSQDPNTNMTLAPDQISRRLMGHIYCSKTGGGVPSTNAVYLGITSGTCVNVVGAINEFTTSGPTFNYLTGNTYMMVHLDSTGKVFYKSGDTNLSIGLDCMGYWVTEWY